MCHPSCIGLLIILLVFRTFCLTFRSLAPIVTAFRTFLCDKVVWNVWEDDRCVFSEAYSDTIIGGDAMDVNVAKTMRVESFGEWDKDVVRAEDFVMVFVGVADACDKHVAG